VQPKRILSLFVLASAGLYAQTVVSSLIGTVIDKTNGVISGAEVKVIDQGTRISRIVTTDATGVFRVSNIPPSVYCLAVKREGFKSWASIDIALSSSETRDMGRITLEVGSVNEQMAVDAEATPVQTKSSEKSSLIDAEQFSRIALKGRDLFGFMSLMPGIVDTANRDVTSPSAISGITIYGNTSAKNFTVDGITDLDTGSNTSLHFEPNMDAIQEIKVLTSNYQAEFGRNSGGQISVITKSGNREWHGTASWNHRHEEFNANSFFNNRSGLNRTPYRFNVGTWSIGGPIYVPLVKRAKNKLFFFASQEYTRQFVNATTQYRTMPTVPERSGDFSQSYAGNGALIKVVDPLNGLQFPGNLIPQSRVDSMGLAILNFLPKPNNPYGAATAGVTSLANSYNFQDAGSSPHPRRNDVIRIDVNPSQKLFGYFRYIADSDSQVTLYQGVQFKTGVVDHPNPGHGFGASVGYVLSPNSINEVTVGKSYNSWSYYEQNPAQVDRSLVGNIPFMFRKSITPASNPNGMHNYVPSISFGTAPANTATIGTGTAEYFNANDIYSFQDNFTYNRGTHTIKAGVYLERNFKLQPGGNTYAGVLSFAPDANNPLNTGNGYANALLGNFLSYQEATTRTVYNIAYWNTEFYLQDNWRVNRKLTVDVGVRFYRPTPQIDLNNTFAYFDPASYSKTGMSRMYVPGIDAKGKRVAKDPLTGATALASYIGLFVPNSGNPASGMKVPGLEGVSSNSYATSVLAAAPRFGFAYDLFGTGHTAVRGGWGMFFNRLDGNQVSNMSGQAPVAFSPTVYYQSLSSIANSTGLFGPGTINYFAGEVPFDRVQNASLGVQQKLPGGMVLDAAYVGNWGMKLPLRVNMNPVPLGANFLPASADSTQPGKALPANLLRTAYPGYGDLNKLAFLGHTNYHSMQISLMRRFARSVMYGGSYTWSHSMGTTAFDPLVADNEARNYGPTTADRRHLLSVFYSIDLPNPAKHLGVKHLSAFTDKWTLSGVTQFSTGAPFSPTCTSTAGADITGSASETARCNAVADSKTSGLPGTFLNTAAFQLAPVGTIGNLGVNALTGPGYLNSDVTLQKFIRIRGDHSGLKLQFQGYNVFNHTQFSSYTAAGQFNAAGVQTNSDFGRASAARPARILSGAVRFEF
jgi:hypothetical protein